MTDLILDEEVRERRRQVNDLRALPLVDAMAIINAPVFDAERVAHLEEMVAAGDEALARFPGDEVYARLTRQYRETLATFARAAA